MGIVEEMDGAEQSSKEAKENAHREVKLFTISF
jgi:hypothetical protein